MRLKFIGKKFLSKFPFLDGLFRRYIWSRLHFPEVEMKFLNELPGDSVDVAIDVGAALGSYSWILNRKSKMVLAFEPGAVHNAYLSRLVFATNINVIRSAVGSVNADVNMFTPGSDTNAFHSATLSQTNPVVSTDDIKIDLVKQIRIDDYLSNYLTANRTVDILKVDVEGYELEVFQGANETLKTHHPLIICEIEARHNENYQAVFELLLNLGYSCYIFRSGKIELYSDKRIEDLQLESDLKIRIGKDYLPGDNKYINNFVFQHPLTRIKVKK